MSESDDFFEQAVQACHLSSSYNHPEIIVGVCQEVLGEMLVFWQQACDHSKREGRLDLHDRCLKQVSAIKTSRILLSRISVEPAVAIDVFNTDIH